MAPLKKYSKRRQPHSGTKLLDMKRVSMPIFFLAINLVIEP